MSWVGARDGVTIRIWDAAVHTPTEPGGRMTTVVNKIIQQWTSVEEIGENPELLKVGIPIDRTGFFERLRLI